MYSFYPLRLSARLCFAAALLCMASPFRENWLPFVVLIVLAAAACFAAGDGRGARRLLPGALPLLALPLARDVLSAAALVVLSAYTLYYLTACDAEVKPWKYRREAVLLDVFVVLIPLVVLIVYNVENRMEFGARIVFFSIPTRWLVLGCILLTLLALRAMRIGSAGRPGWELGNAALMAAPVAAGAVLAGILVLLKPVFVLLLKLLSVVFGGALSLLTALWQWLLGVQLSGNLSETQELELDEALRLLWEFLRLLLTRVFRLFDVSLFDVSGKGKQLAASQAEAEPPWRSQAEAEPPWSKIVLLAAGIVLAAVLVWCLVKQLRMPQGASGKKRAERVKAQWIEGTRRERRRRRKGRRWAQMTNCGRIRFLYREYLSYLKAQGICVQKCDTTADVSDAAMCRLRESDETLRALYRMARYSGTDPDDAAVAAAEAALERLTGKQNETNSADAIALKS